MAARDRILQLANLRKNNLAPSIPMAPAEILAVKQERAEEEKKKAEAQRLAAPPPSKVPIVLDDEEAPAGVTGGSLKGVPPVGDAAVVKEPAQLKQRSITETLKTAALKTSFPPVMLKVGGALKPLTVQPAQKAGGTPKPLTAQSAQKAGGASLLPAASGKESEGRKADAAVEEKRPAPDEEKKKKKKKVSEEGRGSPRQSGGVVTFSGAFLPKALATRDPSKGTPVPAAGDKDVASSSRTPRGVMLPFTDLLHTPGFLGVAEREVEAGKDTVESLRVVIEGLQRENAALKEGKAQAEHRAQGMSDWGRAVDRQLLEAKHTSKVLMDDVALLKQAILPPEGEPRDSWAEMKAEVLEGAFVVAAKRGWMRPRVIRDPLFRHYFTRRWDEVQVALATDSSAKRRAMKKRKRASEDQASPSLPS